jgi:hypothetical protein
LKRGRWSFSGVIEIKTGEWSIVPAFGLWKKPEAGKPSLSTGTSQKRASNTVSHLQRSDQADKDKPLKRVAPMIDKILKGAKPTDPPVEAD